MFVYIPTSIILSNIQPPPSDTSTPKEPSSNQLTEIEIDTKRMPPKQRRARRKITLPAQIAPANTSQLQEQETSSVSTEKVAVIECSTTGELPSIEKPLVTEKSATAAVDEPIREKEPIEKSPSPVEKEPVKKKSSRAKKTAAKASTANRSTAKKRAVEKEPPVEEPSVKKPSVEEPSIEEPSVEDPSVEEPSVEEPSVEPSVEEPSVEEPSVEPSVEEPSVEEPSVEEPSVEEPSAEEPSLDDPSLEGPSVELPSVEEPELAGSKEVMILRTMYCVCMYVYAFVHRHVYACMSVYPCKHMYILYIYILNFYYISECAIYK